MKVIEGFNKTKFVTDFEGFTESDFIVEIDKATSWKGYCSKCVKLILKPEVAEQYSDILVDKYTYFSIDRTNILKGVRKDKQNAKIDQVLKELDEEILDLYIVNQIELFNNVILERIRTNNSKYIETQECVYLGEQLQTDYIRQYLDDEDVNLDIEVMDEQIELLRAKREILYKKQSQVRSENMVKILKEENELPETVLKNIVAKLKNGEGFKTKHIFGRRG
jgi:hypothetical protein